MCKRLLTISAMLVSIAFLDVPSLAQSLLEEKIETARDMVRNNLSDPFSAQFRNDRILKGGTVCGEVNMKNRMGGYNGYLTYAVTFDSATNSDWEVLFPIGGEGQVLYDFRRDAAQMLCDPNR